MDNGVLLNKKSVRKNKALKHAQRLDKKENHDRKLDKKSIVKRNIGKLVSLSSEELVGMTKEQGNGQLLTETELLQKLDELNVTGMSGSGFPIAEKLNTFLKNKTKVQDKVIIINGAECELGLCHDVWLMKHKATQLKEALEVLKKTIPAGHIIVATRGPKEDAKAFCANGVKHCKVPLKYPMGEEHILIEQILERKLKKTDIPAEHGILVMNIQSVYQFWRVANGSYDEGRFVTLADLRNGTARVAYVKKDTIIEEMLQKCFGKFSAECYAGTGVMYAGKIDRSSTFSHQTGFACIAESVEINNDNSCRKCGGCTKKCPVGINVREIVLAREKNPNADISMWHPENCIHCSTCTYFCAAGKNIAEYMRL